MNASRVPRNRPVATDVTGVVFTCVGSAKEFCTAWKRYFGDRAAFWWEGPILTVNDGGERRRRGIDSDVIEDAAEEMERAVRANPRAAVTVIGLGRTGRTMVDMSVYVSQDGHLLWYYEEHDEFVRE